jgi:hypothetical protein
MKRLTNHIEGSQVYLWKKTDNTSLELGECRPCRLRTAARSAASARADAWTDWGRGQ